MHIGGVISGARQFCYPNDKCEMQMKCCAIQFDMKWQCNDLKVFYSNFMSMTFDLQGCSQKSDDFMLLKQSDFYEQPSIKAKFYKKHARKIFKYFPKLFVKGHFPAVTQGRIVQIFGFYEFAKLHFKKWSSRNVNNNFGVNCISAKDFWAGR